MAEAIKVAVRVRPFNQREKDLKSQLCIQMSGQNTTVLCSPPKTFTFDFSYWSHTDQSDPAFADQDVIMKDIGEVILANALNGFNGCLFAYGQTGSGKSYSVMGFGDSPGIIPRSVDKIFEEKRVLEEDAHKEICIWISYVEIYNEMTRDLLYVGSEPPELKIRDHPKFGTYIPDLTESPCRSPEDVQKLMDFGMKKRVVGSTQMNATSSRSHAVFTVKVQFLEGKKPDPGTEDSRTALSAKINLVDLAGSERQSKTGAAGAALKEGCMINQSLSTLGLVIKELSEAQMKKGGKDAVAPFRASKLTFLLKDSLAGNSKTYMIAALSPASDNIDETISTLRFASSVKKIKTVATQNKDKKDQMIEALQEEIKRLKAFVGEEGGGAIRQTQRRASQVQAEEMERLMAEMKKSFQEQIKNSDTMEHARQEALADGGLNREAINEAFGVDSKTPYLLNMSSDPMLAGCLLYFVMEGVSTTIGSQKENTITLKGIGIPDQLCKIENEGNTKLTISRLGRAGRVVVNGKLLNEETSMGLNHNDKIFLGRAYALKLTLPSAAGNGQDDGLSLEGLEDQWSALNDSPSWCGLQMYLDQILRQIPPDQAKNLFDDVKEGCKLCDEANDITAEIRADDWLHFEVDLTSSVPSLVVVRVLRSPESPFTDAGVTLYLWSSSTMRERLERMRDTYEAFCRKGVCDVDVLVDPWHETPPVEISSRLTELQAACDDLLEENARLKNEKQSQFGKTLLMFFDDKGEKQAAICFRAWAAHVVSIRKSRQKMPVKHKRQISLNRSASNLSHASSPRVGERSPPTPREISPTTKTDGSDRTPTPPSPTTTVTTGLAVKAKTASVDESSPALSSSSTTTILGANAKSISLTDSTNTRATASSAAAPGAAPAEFCPSEVSEDLDPRIGRVGPDSIEVIKKFQEVMASIPQEVLASMPELKVDSQTAPECTRSQSQIENTAMEAPPRLNRGAKTTQTEIATEMGLENLLDGLTRTICGENGSVRRQLERQLCSILQRRIESQDDNCLRKDHANVAVSRSSRSSSRAARHASPRASPRAISPSSDCSRRATHRVSPRAISPLRFGDGLVRTDSQPLDLQQGVFFRSPSAAVVGLQTGPLIIQHPTRGSLQAHPLAAAPSPVAAAPSPVISTTPITPMTVITPVQLSPRSVFRSPYVKSPPSLGRAV